MTRLLIWLMATLSCVELEAQQLTPRELSEDLDSLRATLETYSAYLSVNGYEYQQHIDSLRKAFDRPVGASTFGLAVRDLIGELQDAHSRVDFERDVDEDPGELPFATATLGDRVVALDSTFVGYLAPRFPYLAAINDTDIDALLHVAGARYRGHSPQRYFSRAVDELEEIEVVLRRVGALRDDTLLVRLTNGIGDTTLLLHIAERQPTQFGLQGPTAWVFGPDDTAYLRIPNMYNNDYVGDAYGLAMVQAAMESASFAESQGMIIDVRGNTGGTRDVLHYLLPYFITEPFVYNAAKAKHDTVGLGDRHLHHPDDPTLTATQRLAARAFAERFEPSWQYDEDAFLPGLYVAVIDDRATPYDYSDRPVVVLMNEWSFSATDIFLGAFAELPNVTLLGTASAGGSGRSRDYELPNSGVVVRLSTMASFRPNGELYDGLGIEPDVVVLLTEADVVGGDDSQLLAAIRILRRQTEVRN